MRNLLAGILIGALLLIWTSCGAPSTLGKSCANDANCGADYICLSKICADPSDPGISKDPRLTQGKISSIHRYISGSRIKARYLEGEDGSKQFLGWWDEKLKQECTWRTPNQATFGVINSDKYYCVTPSLKIYSSPYSNLFLDSNCKIRFFPSTCEVDATSTFIVEAYGNADACPVKKAIYSCYGVGQKTPNPGMIYSKSTNGQCSEDKVRLDGLRSIGYKHYYRISGDCKEEVLFNGFATAEIKTDQ